MLVVLTGPVRSGKSREGLRLAVASGRRVFVAVGARADDEEMTRRIERHHSERPPSATVVETADDAAWLSRVPDDACLIVDCLGTVLGGAIVGLVPPDADLAVEEAEAQANAAADALVEALIGRAGPTVVVTNEVGWGVVPATPLGRLFRDVLGRANRRLVDSADAAYVVVSGRCIDIGSLPREVSWPDAQR